MTESFCEKYHDGMSKTKEFAENNSDETWVDSDGYLRQVTVCAMHGGTRTWRCYKHTLSGDWLCYMHIPEERREKSI